MPEDKNLIQQNITDTLEINYMPYAMSVIVSRAIPEIDGFKPAHRKLLYTMYSMGLLKGKRIKSADVVGQTMRLNPHGDAAIYETLVRLTRGNEALLHPFIDSKGNFGKQTSRDMAYAASRYTEVKLDTICEELFKDIEKNTVDLIDNYNNTSKEPVLFPTTFPNVLITPNLGIAVGMASSICSFNLKEMCTATMEYLKNPEVDLTKYILGPDFSTYGEFIYNKEDLMQVFETGRGSFKIRGKYRYDKKNSCIEVYEIPYTTTLEVIIDKIISLVKSNKIKDIVDVRDETDLNGLKIAIDIKRSCDPHILMNKLYRMTSLQDNFSCNFNILIDGMPMTLGVRDILGHWVTFRMRCLRRQIAFDIEKKTNQYHLLEGLSKIILDIDRAIRIVRETEADKEVLPNLMDAFDIDRTQAEYVAEIKLRNLNKEFLLNKTNEMDHLREEIEDLKDLLENESRIKEVIRKQLKEMIKKYGGERKTTIISEDVIEQIHENDLIEDYSVKFFLTKHNYFKKIPLVSLRSASDQNVKEQDAVFLELDGTNKSDVLFFSNKQNLYKLKSFDIPDCKASSLGEYLMNLLKLEEDEEILYCVATVDYKGFMFFGFDNGKMAKIPLESYATKVNRRKLVNAFSDKATCIFIDYSLEDKDYMVIRNQDRGLLFSATLLPEKNTKNAQGIQVMILKKSTFVTKIVEASLFQSEDIEYYRSKTIPARGHFLVEKDKMENPC